MHLFCFHANSDGWVSCYLSNRDTSIEQRLKYSVRPVGPLLGTGVSRYTTVSRCRRTMKKMVESTEQVFGDIDALPIKTVDHQMKL